MKISISTEPLTSRFPIHQVFDMVAAAGFEAVDLGLFSKEDLNRLGGDDYIHMARDMAKAARDSGVEIGQLHAPFPSYVHGNESRTTKMQALILRSLEVAAELNCPPVIVHPVTISPSIPVFSDHPGMFELNMAMYEVLLPTARRLGVPIAVENLFADNPQGPGKICCFSSKVEDMIELMDAMGDGAVACLDVGHSVLTKQDIGSQVRALGNRLTALHIQSNDGITDLHTLPYQQDAVDWTGLMAELEAIGYRGNFNLEVFGFFEHMPNELIPAALNFAAASARCATGRK